MVRDRRSLLDQLGYERVLAGRVPPRTVPHERQRYLSHGEGVVFGENVAVCGRYSLGTPRDSNKR